MSDKTPAVLVDQASKWYGEVIGINDVSLAIDGGVTGVLGPNGAGKSTLFKLLMGRLKPSQGSVRLFGVDPWTNTAPYRRVGYVSESERMYDWMTGLDFVTTLARLHGMTREEATARAKHVLNFVGLSDVQNKELGKYSKGMRQRVKIAHALVHDPDLIILDEPLHGCDPIARVSPSSSRATSSRRSSVSPSRLSYSTTADCWRSATCTPSGACSTSTPIVSC